MGFKTHDIPYFGVSKLAYLMGHQQHIIMCLSVLVLLLAYPAILDRGGSEPWKGWLYDGRGGEWEGQDDDECKSEKHMKTINWSLEWCEEGH
jgi:hypothetical protein